MDMSRRSRVRSKLGDNLCEAVRRLTLFLSKTSTDAYHP
jgi:hypothetical protein